MSQPEITIEKAALTLKLLGDKTRLTMVGLLKDNECCVCELVDVFQMSQPSISQHLRKLRDAGIVKEKRKGQWIFYSLNKESASFPLVMNILNYLPDQKEKLDCLEADGKRIVCD
ncbi:transcriptional regulator [Virgibacillus phasianinus]|uniref:Transcriptional regulator n=1 Tax=Virgibacillus phasianinus TaxID=2017483 RepID=A0A220U780_9BACI|nr:metalloregulator ArsR/SmtB family transcription factor [Virgibacillus phasianinus]ASK63822.1 transcriptional regulator [Virgibacillus phasianinus]